VPPHVEDPASFVGAAWSSDHHASMLEAHDVGGAFAAALDIA
jgi:hypothetical protein